MAVAYGSIYPATYKIGTTTVTAIYLGAQSVWPDAPTPVITITQQPANRSVSAGSSGANATFTVVATVTTGTLSYQWYRQAKGVGALIMIAGATDSTLSLSGLVHSDNHADNYRCVVSAAGATSVTSRAAILLILQPFLSLISETRRVTAIDIGTDTINLSATLSIVVEASVGTISYQWKQGFVFFADIPGETSTSLTISGLNYSSNFTTRYLCDYRIVEYTDSNGNAISGTTNFLVIDKPSPPVVSGPVASINASGGAVEISVSASTEVGSLTYRWYRYPQGANTPLAIGSDSPALYLSGLTSEVNSGDKYRCFVFNSGSTIKTISGYCTLIFT